MGCCCCGIGLAAERQFTEKRATKDLAEYRSQGPGPTTRLLLAGLAKAGAVRGRLLDVGAGVGTMTFELLNQGLTSAVGVDLSSSYVAAASQEASRRGHSESIQFVHGDFLDVADRLPTADVVTLDRVVCCYPDYERLLAESLRHADSYLALSYPRDRWYVRTGVRLENLVRRCTRNPFRTFVHSAAAMENVIRRTGFTLIDRRCTRAWSADVYGRSMSS